MKDHEIRELVTELTEVAQQYGQTQQLRERIRGVVFKHIPPSFFETKEKSVKIDERARFEEWAKGKYSTRYIGTWMDRDADAYEYTKIAEAAWDAWQARSKSH